MNVMAVSPSSSTEETTNACRACRLLLGPCTDQMRDVLRHHVPPSTFPQVINKKISNLPRLTAPQLNLIFPRGSTYSGNYNDMDISLLYTLLRNICSIPPHRKGCGNDPDPTDRSLSANIERIRIARNQCVHSSSPVLSNSDFITIWSTVKSAVMDLDSFLNNGNQYDREVDFLRQETMDPVCEGHYTEELRKQAEEDEPTIEKVHDLKRKLEEIDAGRIGNQSQILRMIDNFSNAVIPPNVRAVYDIDVSYWRDNDKVFYECDNFPAMLEKVKNQTHVTFVGVPGSGKTATARHIALMLQQEGYEIVPIKDIRKIEDYCDPHSPQVFVIDDVVGVFGLQKAKLNLLFNYEDRISRPVMQSSKTLMTCREAVYRKSFESSSFFTNENNIILLHSKDNILTNSDKINLLKMYNINYNMFSDANLSSTSKMFPYLCKLFSSEKKFKSYGTAFFENPVPYILNELEEMKKQNKIQYASLVLCMMNENKISENILEETNKEKVAKSFQEMKKRVLWKCKVSSETNNYKFVDALSAMEGTYTKMYGTEYSFVHDSMFEVLAYHFGCQFPELILQYMSSSYIANNVKLQQHNEHKMQNLESEHKQESENIEVCGECKEEEGNVALNGKSRENMELFDLYIRLREDQYSMLTERLYKDVENMELYDVFMNDILKEPKVCKGFIEVLKTKSYTVLKFLFLSVQKNVFKVVSKKERLDKESEGRIGKMKWPRQRFMAYRDLRGQEVLVNERKKEYKIRVISWVIYYGHNHILQFILEQTDLHKETQSELFTNSLNPELSLITEEGEANKNTEQYRLLVLSCYSGDLEIVRKILKHFNRSINLRALTNFNYEHCIYDTPLTVACMEGHINIVQELIEEGADINHQGEYNTPLTAACEGGHISVVKELIQAGADINLRGEINTPLVTASECGHKSLVTELIEMGADVNPATQFDSPLTTACVGGEISLIKELIKAGADVNPQGKYNTPLKKACLGGDLSLVKMLIEAGANVNLQDRSGPPLTACCDDRHLSIVKELLKAGADVNQQGRFYSPLARACTDGQIGVVKVLLEKDANINTGDNLGRTPLYLTILDEPENLIPVIQILNKYGADSSICNKQGLSSLHIALLKHKNDVVNQLLRAEDERQLNKLKLHLFECLVNIRHSNVMTDCKGNVVTTQRRVWRMEELGDLYRIIRENKCDELKHLLDVGLDVNQWIQLYNNINFEGFTSTYESDVRPVLFTLIDEKRVSDKVGKVLTLLEGGADVNIRVKYRESDFVLDREGVSILERIRQLMNKLRESEYWWETKDVTECERMLSEKNVFKAVSKKERLDKESEGRIGKMKWPRQRFMTYRDMRGQEVLVNERKKEYKVRVISWVIYYGHNQILQFILEQTDIHKETQSELFTNSLNPNLSLATVITEEEEAKQNIEQYRLLVLSCYSGDLGIVRKILKYFNRSINSRLLTNFNYEHCVYDTPLTVACMEGHINIVKELIEEGADINHQGEYNTPLTAACEGGHIRLVKELIQAGADINLRGEINTPLVTACECGHKSLVTDLIDMGADVNPATQFDSPLTTACVGGEMSLIKELIKAGADVNPQSKYNTPLKKACLGGDLSLVKMLIEAGADVNLQDRSRPPLTACCDDRHLSIVKELLKAGAVVNQQGRFYSPLARACTDGQIGVVKVLLEKDAHINTGDNLGGTPLYLTILDEPKNLIPVIQILNKYGADSSICNKQGLSSLHIALLKHKNDVVNQLLRAEDERQLNKLKLHLFECLVNIRHSNVMTDCKGNVVTTQRRVWRMEELGDLYRIIRENKCDELKHLLDVGLDVNQRIELYNNINFEGFTSTYESDVRPLLFTLIDEKRVSDKVGKILTLLEGGADVNIRVKYRESDFVLDREGVSILERIRQLMNKLRESEYWWETKDVTECERMLSEVKKNVRRYSV